MYFLIVEDNSSVRNSLRQWMESVFPQFKILEAASAEEAILLCGDYEPQLVLMDIGLPKMNGIEATRVIKSRQPATQIMMLSIHEDNYYREEALKAGAQGYVTKREMHSRLVPELLKFVAAMPENININKKNLN